LGLRRSKIGTGFFIWPEWLLELRVRFHKEGSRKMSEITTSHEQSQSCAGIDIGKAWLDIALADGCLLERRPNTPDGHSLLLVDLHRHKVRRIGLEATGGYERSIVTALHEAGFEVHLFQPREVRAYATYTRLRAKSDSIDAKLIARCTAHLDTVRAAADTRLSALSQALTLIDQISEDLSRAKIRCEHITDPEVLAYHQGEIKRLKAMKRAKYKQIEARIKLHPDLATKLDLIVSIRGIGMITALAFVIRAPELGSVSREEAAALIGVAPMVRESGTYKGERHVAGGRMRMRTDAYACTQAAIKWNLELKGFYDRLIKNGKHHRCAIVACTRKLVIFVNTVLKRQTLWQTEPIKNPKV
jgi:transposase